jgi:hypothetical protein
MIPPVVAYLLGWGDSEFHSMLPSSKRLRKRFYARLGRRLGQGAKYQRDLKLAAAPKRRPRAQRKRAAFRPPFRVVRASAQLE